MTTENTNEDAMYEDYAEIMREEEAKYQKKFDETKTQVIEIMGEEWWKQLEVILSDDWEEWDPWSEHHTPRIVDEKVGKHQDVNNDLIKEEWVNQTVNGGMTGDEFAGTVCFNLKNDKYLQLSYSM